MEETNTFHTYTVMFQTPSGREGQQKVIATSGKDAAKAVKRKGRGRAICLIKEDDSEFQLPCVFGA